MALEAWAARKAASAPRMGWRQTLQAEPPNAPTRHAQALLADTPRRCCRLPSFPHRHRALPCASARTCANACSIVWTTLELVHVMVGTSALPAALVSRLVLMYTTCRLLGVAAACSVAGREGRRVCEKLQRALEAHSAKASALPRGGWSCEGHLCACSEPESTCFGHNPPAKGTRHRPPTRLPLPGSSRWATKTCGTPGVGPWGPGRRKAGAQGQTRGRHTTRSAEGHFATEANEMLLNNLLKPHAAIWFVNYAHIHKRTRTSARAPHTH